MSENRYVVRIGRFDHKLGPICVLFRYMNGKYCNFYQKECTSNISSKFKSAILNRQHLFFEDNMGFFQVIHIAIPRPGKRGNIERYTVIIRISKGLGQIKPKILEEMKSDFYQLFPSSSYEPTNEDFLKYILKWNEALENTLDVTDRTEYIRNYRDKLNIACGNLELVLMDTDNVLPELYKEFLNEALIVLFELDTLIKSEEIEEKTENSDSKPQLI